MKAHGSAVTFHVSNLARSLEYYTQVLGFTEQFRFGDYAGVQYDDVQIHLSGPQALNKKLVGQGAMYVFCHGVDEYYEQVRQAGAKIQAPPRNYEYGMRDFVVEDPDTNHIAFGQELKPGETPSEAEES